MNRRHLLALLPATAALASVRALNAQTLEKSSQGSKPDFKICVQAYSFRNFTVYQAIERTAAAGADAIELYPGQKLGADDSDAKLDPGLDDARIAALLDHCKKHKITVANFGVTSISRNESDARKVFEFGRKLGVYGITTESVDALDTAEKLAKEYDVKVCIHNHRTKENYIPGDPAKVWQLIRDRDERIGYCADLGHWATSGFDPLEIVRKVAPRIRAFHAKDREHFNGPSRDLPFGRGKIQLAEILKEVAKHGFAGNVSIEYEHNWDNSVAEIGQCAGYLRGCAASNP